MSHECAKLKFPKFSLASIQVDPRPCFAEDVSCVEALKQFLPDSLLQLLPGWEHSRSSCKFEGKEKLVKRIIYSACGLIVRLCLIAGASCFVGHVSSEENLAIEGVIQELHWASYLLTSQWDAHVMWVFFPAFQPFPLVPGLRSPEASSLTAGSCPDSANLWGLWQFGGMWMKMNGKCSKCINTDCIEDHQSKVIKIENDETIWSHTMKLASKLLHFSSQLIRLRLKVRALADLAAVSYRRKRGEAPSGQGGDESKGQGVVPRHKLGTQNSIPNSDFWWNAVETKFETCTPRHPDMPASLSIWWLLSYSKSTCKW